MGRLTEWVGADENRHAIPRTDIRKNGHQRCCNKLAHYEDLEEAGRLIELPCAVGDTVYIPNERFPAEIDEIRITPSGIFAEYVQYDRSYELTELWDGGSFCIEDIGKEVFFTKEEAEAKLKELEGE